MIVGVGIDSLEVARMRRELAREGGGFRDDVFTPGEVADCAGAGDPGRHFAARFVAKEATLKALGTGADAWSAFREVEVTRGRRGEPAIVLHERVKRLAADRGVRQVLVSFSHTARAATASVVLET